MRTRGQGRQESASNNVIAVEQMEFSFEHKFRSSKVEFVFDKGEVSYVNPLHIHCCPLLAVQLLGRKDNSLLLCVLVKEEGQTCNFINDVEGSHNLEKNVESYNLMQINSRMFNSLNHKE